MLLRKLARKDFDLVEGENELAERLVEPANLFGGAGELVVRQINVAQRLEEADEGVHRLQPIVVQNQIFQLLQVAQILSRRTSTTTNPPLAKLKKTHLERVQRLNLVGRRLERDQIDQQTQLIQTRLSNNTNDKERRTSAGNDTI